MNWKEWFADNDWWYLAVIGAILLIVLIPFHLWGLEIIIVGIGLSVAIAEFVFVKRLNISVSDDYRRWRMTHRVQSAIVLFLIVALMVALVYHFTRPYIP